VPRNAITSAGGYDTKEAKALMKKYFGQVSRRPMARFKTLRTVSVKKSSYHQDNFIHCSNYHDLAVCKADAYAKCIDGLSFERTLP
jgi:hypothetical protein